VKNANVVIVVSVVLAALVALIVTNHAEWVLPVLALGGFVVGALLD
jgi:Cu/Ag efflux pump CusA